METDTVVTIVSQNDETSVQPMNKKMIESLSDEELLQDIGEDSEDD